MPVEVTDPLPIGTPQWWAARASATRDRVSQPGRPSLDLQRILDAAIEIVDEGGPELLSMRKLADRLQSGTATLYRHFRSKEEILVLVVDQVLGEVGDDEDDQAPDWRAACRRRALSLHGLLQRHPNLLPILLAQMPGGPNARRLRERAIRGFLDGGFPPAVAAKSHSAVLSYVLGAAQRIISGRSAPGGRHLREVYREMEPDAFTATATAVAVMADISDEDEFRFGLELMLDGLQAARAGYPA